MNRHLQIVNSLFTIWYCKYGFEKPILLSRIKVIIIIIIIIIIILITKIIIIVIIIIIIIIVLMFCGAARLALFLAYS